MSVAILPASHCMDLDRLGHGAPYWRDENSPRTRLYSTQSQHVEPQRSQAYSSSPLQTEWYQPRARIRHPRESRHHSRRVVSAQYTSEPRAPSEISVSRFRPPTSRRIQDDRFHDLVSWIDDVIEQQPVASSSVSLYPYQAYRDERFSVISVTDEMDHHNARYASHNSSPGPQYATFQPSRPEVSQFAAGDDGAFEYPEDFHLFAEATVGLGLEDSCSRSDGALDWSNSQVQHRIARRPVPVRSSESFNPSIPAVSPVDDGSMTMLAMRHVAQMPDASSLNLTSPNLQRSFSQPLPVDPVVSPVEQLEDSEDDLPDYVESQEQVYLESRMKAARRAQELQMRWRLSGRQRGL